MRILLFLVAAGLTLFQTGCTNYLIHQATRPGQVYVVCGHLFTSDEVYTCDARNNAPVCYPTQEFARR